MGSTFWVIGPSHLTSFLEDNIIANAIDYTPQPDGKTLLIKYHIFMLSKMIKWRSCPSRSFSPIKNLWKVLYLIQEMKNILQYHLAMNSESTYKCPDCKKYWLYSDTNVTEVGSCFLKLDVGLILLYGNPNWHW